MEPSACGKALEQTPEAFGRLEDASGFSEDVSRLRQILNERGYLYLRGFHPREEVRAARHALTRRLSEAGFLDPDRPEDEACAAPHLKIVNRRSAFRPSDGNGEDLRVKTYNADDLTKNNPALRNLFFGPRLLGFFEKFFGGAVRHYNYTWLRAVSPGTGTAPHCDWVYMSRGTPNLLTTWIPIGDISVRLGGLMILENSHRQSDRLSGYLGRDVDEYCTNRPGAREIESGARLYDWDGTLTKNPVALREKFGGRWLTADFQAGDILVFTMRTIHASLDNQSDRIRLSGDSRYQLASEPADERYIVENPVPYAPEFKRGRVC